MKKVKWKETIDNNPQDCLTRSKLQDDEGDNENDLLSLIPLDLIIDIIAKLPAKSRAKLIFVSKFWSSIIGGKDFTELYLAQSSARPRLLCIVYRHQVNIQFFHSCSQEDQFSDHHIIPNSDIWFDFSPPVRGLICCEEDFNKVVITNPTTGQFITLPRVKTRRLHILSFLGYDPVNDVYKVLCMTVKNVRHKRGSKVVSEEHQVFTLGAQNAEWRMIQCKHPHLPPYRTKVLCRNGVVYYYAWINVEGSLISFDLRSEEFNVIKLPEDVRLLEYCNLVNYNGKIAVTSDSFNGTLDLRVLEDASKQEWLKVLVLVPSWRKLVGHYTFWFKGTLRTGELIFAPCSSIKTFYIICYDLKENNARKIVIEGIGNDSEGTKVFLDHIESPMLLSVA